MVLGMCERLSAKSCRSCGHWSWVCVNIFPLSHVDRVVTGPGYVGEHLSAKSCRSWSLVLGMCEHLSAKSCRSCGHWSWVCVNIFPLSHVDRVVTGPGYV